MEKLYHPSQDQILGGLSSTGQVHNVLRGAEQTFQITHRLEDAKDNGSEMDRGEDQSMESASPARARAKD